MTAMVLDASSLLLLIKSRGVEASDTLRDAATVPLAVYEVGNALRTSLRHGLTYYDAAYLAAALSLGAPLITDDRHLAEAARRAEIQTADTASLTA